MSGDLSLDEFEALFNAHIAGTIPVVPLPQVEVFNMLDVDEDMKISVTEISFYMDNNDVSEVTNGHTS